MSTATRETVAIDELDCGDELSISTIDVDAVVVDVLGSFFGGSGVICVDESRHLRVTPADDGVRIDEWDGMTYRWVAHCMALERRGGRVVAPEGQTRAITRRERRSGVTVA